MKKLTIILLLACIMLVGCDDTPAKPSADAQQQKQTEQAMKEANAQVGMPAIKNYQEKKLAKMIYELRDKEDLICYAYLKSREGLPVYLGKCVGFGLPYCVQFSNPEKIVVNRRSSTYGSIFGTLPQPEPNGLFMPETLSATWLMMIDPKTGDVRPVYIEPEIIVSPFPLI